MIAPSLSFLTGLQEDPVQDAEHRQPSQAKGVRFDDADITLAAATPPAGRKSICNTDAGALPFEETHDGPGKQLCMHKLCHVSHSVASI